MPLFDCRFPEDGRGFLSPPSLPPKPSTYITCSQVPALLSDLDNLLSSWIAGTYSQAQTEPVLFNDGSQLAPNGDGIFKVGYNGAYLHWTVDPNDCDGVCSTFGRINPIYLKVSGFAGRPSFVFYTTPIRFLWFDGLWFEHATSSAPLVESISETYVRSCYASGKTLFGVKETLFGQNLECMTIATDPLSPDGFVAGSSFDIGVAKTGIVGALSSNKLRVYFIDFASGAAVWADETMLGMNDIRRLVVGETRAVVVGRAGTTPRFVFFDLTQFPPLLQGAKECVGLFDFYRAPTISNHFYQEYVILEGWRADAPIVVMDMTSMTIERVIRHNRSLRGIVMDNMAYAFIIENGLWWKMTPSPFVSPASIEAGQQPFIVSDVGVQLTDYPVTLNWNTVTLPFNDLSNGNTYISSPGQSPTPWVPATSTPPTLPADPYLITC